jgi:hypothetical protein
MTSNIRLGLFAVSAFALLSLAACKTDDAAQESAPPAAQATPTETGTPPADDTGMPAPASSAAPAADTGTPPGTP